MDAGGKPRREQALPQYRFSPAGAATGTPVAAGRPKSGVPSAFHVKRCARGDRLFPHP